MITRLIIARHGNTFRPHETPRRVGSSTDLPLTEFNKGKAIGDWLLKNNVIPSKIYAAPLKRTQQTAELVLEQLKSTIPLQLDRRFVEIDYGPDENKTEEEVWKRLGSLAAVTSMDDLSIQNIGKEVVKKWNTRGEVPPEWKVNVPALKAVWYSLAQEIEEGSKGENVLVVTSNGIARFAPVLTNNFDTFAAHNSLKIATGALCIFEKSTTDTSWECKEWNLIP